MVQFKSQDFQIYSAKFTNKNIFNVSNKSTQEKLWPWFKVQNKDSSTISNSEENTILQNSFSSQITSDYSSWVDVIIVAWFKFHKVYFPLLLLSLQNVNYNSHVLHIINCKKYCWKCQSSLWQLPVKELFLNKVKVCRSENINEFLQSNFSEIKLNRIGLRLCKSFFSKYPLMIERYH